jgi:membrane-bound metal-dependent hydrolase YbcI (DUF457 family)
MMGTNHAALGVTVFCGAVWAGQSYLGLPHLTVAQGALGGIVAVGSALAPDLDEGHSLASTATGANATGLRRLAGGHRRRTHCIIAVAVVAALTVACSSNRTASAILVGFGATAGAAVISRRLRHAGALLCIPFGTVVGEASFHWVPGGWWLLVAVALPYASHLLGDGVTEDGVPLWMGLQFLGLPKRFTHRKFALHLFHVGRRPERLIVTPALHILSAWAAYCAFAPTVTAAAHNYPGALR